MYRDIGRAFLLSFCVSTAHAESPSFDVEVEAVLSKAGCNAGTCHGNQNGKGGLKLSLRGQDPWFDYQSLVVQQSGRRVNLIEPDKSLILRKPAMAIAHQGGQRFKKDDPQYSQLKEWIRRGAAPPTHQVQVHQLIVEPAEVVQFSMSPIQLAVQAEFNNGKRRDVTDMAVYETANLSIEVSPSGEVTALAPGESTVIVRYLQQQVPVRVAFFEDRSEFKWRERSPRNFIDELIFAKLRKYRSNPGERCSDDVFLRRAYLDLCGTIPPPQIAKQFVSDPDPHKRSLLIDQLLASPAFADNWTLKWADLLRVEEKVLDRRGVAVFHEWIRDSIASAKPLNEFVSELLLARGSSYDNPPTNYFRALRETNVRGEAAARVFLGTRLQCAQCHNHPFDRWTQEDYYSWAANFARIDYEIVDNKRLDRLDKNQFVGEQLIQVSKEGKVVHPGTGATMRPRFLGDDASLDSQDDPLGELAIWLTESDNSMFAKSQVNRIWFHLMGKGLVDPVDDFRLTNPASHPELLNRLAEEFIRHGYDLRHIVRRIMRSESYQFDSWDTPHGEYSRVMPRRLPAEQLLDAQAQALDATLEFNGHSPGLRAAQLPGVRKIRLREKAPSPADRFLTAFGKPQRQMTCECERSDTTTLSQALFLVNGDCMDDLLTQPNNRIGQLLESGLSLDEVIKDLYWAALSRVPSETELHSSHSILARSASKREGLEDIAWALLNAKEFVFRQ